jgi:hypothetical protein
MDNLTKGQIDEGIAAIEEALRMMRAEEAAYRAPAGGRSQHMAKSVRQDMAHRLATHQRALTAIAAHLANPL